MTVAPDRRLAVATNLPSSSSLQQPTTTLTTTLTTTTGGGSCGGGKWPRQLPLHIIG